MMKLKERIFNRYLAKQPQREPRFPHYERPLKVLLIYESDLLERNDAIKSIRQDMVRRQLDTTMWGYAAKKEIQSANLPQSRILGQKDYNIFGKPHQHVLDELQQEQYDLLIDLTTKPCLPLRYIAMYAKADFKVGLHLGEGVHDMLIAPPGLDTEQARPEASWLFQQIMQYVTTIKSND
ncbi:MAG: hypothetical protein K6A36_05275 [Paludibacteraceae bacterium]|nr:hypothetical protein [Paludibacteraceae bacterium]